MLKEVGLKFKMGSHRLSLRTSKEIYGWQYDNPLEAIALPRDIRATNNDLLTKDVTNKEILEVVKQINLWKLRGQMICRQSYIKKNWDIVDKFVCNIVWPFF